jgi:hypothetical protein
VLLINIVKSFALALVAALMVLNTAGGTVADRRASARLDVPAVFGGFPFVNKRRFTSLTIPPHSGLRHSRMESHPAPSLFDAGWQYIFHCHATNSTDDVYHLLERRLRYYGLKTAAAGEISGERLHPRLLTFEGGGYIGSVSLYPTHFSGRVANTQRAELWDIIVFVSAVPAR